MPVTEAEGRSVESTSPDSSGSLYQEASGWDDQAYGQLQTWLQQNNYTGNTAVSITADEAQNDHTSFDNFYGVGSTGQGTTRHIPFVFSGPGIVSGQTYATTMGIDDMSTNYMYELGLPAPVESRGQVIPGFYTGGAATPTPTATATGTATATPTSPPTSTPTSTSTPSPGSNLVQNGGFEASSSTWVYGSTDHPSRSR